MRNVAIITARGGSKRIPKKNIKDFLGKPIIAYSIEAAINSSLFDKVMVSTDDREIAQIALKYGAEIPFFRSEDTSNDYATTADVIAEVLQEYKKMGEEFDNTCCMYPTAPFITDEILKKAYYTLIKNNFDSVFPISIFSYPIQRALKVEHEKISMIAPENMNKRSQDLVKAYHDAGQFYWLNIKKFLQKRSVMSDNTGAIILDELQVQDIDNEMDWKLAELKYKLLNDNK